MVTLFSSIKNWTPLLDFSRMVSSRGLFLNQAFVIFGISLVCFGCDKGVPNSVEVSESLRVTEELPHSKSEGTSGVVPRIVGIGIALAIDGEYPKVSFVVPGGTADQSGEIEAGDEIVAVISHSERRDARGMTMEEVTSAIRGLAGSQLTLDLSRNGKSFSVDLVRDVVTIENFEFDKSLVGKQIGAVEYAMLVPDDNRRYKFSDFAGKVLVIDVWATLCAPCQKPMDRMQRYMEENPTWEGEVALIGASIDEDRGIAIEHAKKRGWSNTINLHFGQAAIDALDVKVVPLLIVVNRDGTIAYYGDIHGVSIVETVNALLEDR